MIELIIVGVIALAIIIGMIISKKKSHANRKVTKEEVKIDHAPEAMDIIFSDYKKGIKKITKEDLKYFDIDNDKIDGFVFYETNGKVYLDKFLKRKYIDGDILGEDFEIYVKLNGKENVSFTYKVRANGKFSK